eukprot:3814419-Pyramimonas_sp.AAC.1
MSTAYERQGGYLAHFLVDFLGGFLPGLVQRGRFSEGELLVEELADSGAQREMGLVVVPRSEPLPEVTFRVGHLADSSRDGYCRREILLLRPCTRRATNVSVTTFPAVGCEP